MIYYSERKNRRKSVFEKVVTDDSGEITYERTVEMPLYKIKVDGFTYFLLYDDEMVPISTVYQYLNFHLSDSPMNTRSAAATALRLLYCFLSLSTYQLENMGDKEVRELLHFLRGINSNPEKYSTATIRSNNTVNGYLSTYRSYLSFLDIKDNALFDCRDISSMRDFDGVPDQATVRYKNNLRTSAHENDSAPKYISVDVFKRIYKAMTDARDEQSRLIVHLMYGYGLRLGEVLGITTEDITEVHIDGKLTPVIYLRNRMSDAPYQYCKNLPHVTDPKQYATKDYSMATQRIILMYDIYEELIDFINEYHEEMIEKYSDNYEKGYADIISVQNKPDTNHYVFLNRYGRVLSDQTWNNTLRKYFKIAGVPVDNGVRENNLSHRFRHGFAMFHAQFSDHPVGILELQKMMRHKNPISTAVYYNPTEGDQLNTKTDFQQELYKMVPELKRGAKDAASEDNS